MLIKGQIVHISTTDHIQVSHDIHSLDFTTNRLRLISQICLVSSFIIMLLKVNHTGYGINHYPINHVNVQTRVL